jgi:hypothetical protein
MQLELENVTADMIPGCLLGHLIDMGEEEAQQERTRRRELPGALELQQERSRRADQEDLDAVQSDNSDRDEDWHDGVIGVVEGAIRKQRLRVGGGENQLCLSITMRPTALRPT